MGRDKIDVPDYVAERFKNLNDLIENVKERMGRHARQWFERNPEEFREAVIHLLEHGSEEILDWGWSGAKRIHNKILHECQLHFMPKDQPYYVKKGHDFMECWDLTEVITEVLRPPRGRPRKAYDIEKAKKMRAKGMSYRAIEKETGISKSTLHRILKGAPSQK